MARFWTCKKCKARNSRRFTNCPTLECTGKRPKPRKAKHKAILDEMPYEEWVEIFGEQCGICGRKPTNRKLDRDHDHKTGLPRGLLCHIDNRTLSNHIDIEWLENAIEYLKKAENYGRNNPNPKEGNRAP